MSNVITLSSGSEDEDDNFKAKNSKAKPLIPINERLNSSITITKVSPIKQQKKEKDKIEVKKLSKTSQNDVDFIKIKKKYSYDLSKKYSANSVNINKEVPNVIRKLCVEKKTPELVEIDAENEKAEVTSLESINNGTMPTISEVKSIPQENRQKNISELICGLAGVPIEALDATQINPRKAEVLDKVFSPEEKSTSIRNPFSIAARQVPPPLVVKKPKTEQKSSPNHFNHLINFLSEKKSINKMPALKKFEPRGISNDNSNKRFFKDFSGNDANDDDDVKIVSSEVDEIENKNEKVEKAEATVKSKSSEENPKRKREESVELEEDIKRKKEDSAELEVKAKRKKEGNAEPEDKLKLKKIDASETYEEFTNLIKSIEKSPEDREKISLKLTKYHNAANPSYLNSGEFKNLLENSIKELRQEPLKIYHVLKNVLENLKCRKEIKLTKKKIIPDSLPVENHLSSDKKKLMNEFIEPEEFQARPKITKKNERAVKKLGKTIKKLKKKIKELEEAEVDLDDEENSTYFRMQKYRERLCQVYRKLCEYTGESPSAGRMMKTKICFSGTKIQSVNKCIERWLNKMDQFPDFVDVLKLITEQNEKEKLNMTPDQVKTVAETAFREVGMQLQKRRQYDLYDSFSSYLDVEQDPADSDPTLSAALKKNQEEYSKKVEDIINLYVEKQGNAKGEDVPEDEANGSGESDDADEKEIEEIENNLKEETSDEEQDEKILKNGDVEVEALSPSAEVTDKPPSSPTSENTKTDEVISTTPPVKESKNNYRHCKSLKWRLESNTKVKSDLCNGNDKSVSDNKTENHLNSMKDDEKCRENLSVENLKLVEDDKPKTDEKNTRKDPDCEIIELSSPKNKFDWMKDNGLKKNSFLVNYVSVEHSFNKSYENNFTNKFKKFRDKTIGFALNDLTNLNGFDSCKERGRRNFKFFTKKSHKENLNPMLKLNRNFFKHDKVFKLACKKKWDGGFHCTLENKENDVRVNGNDNEKGEERENEREEDVEGQENENSSGSGNGDGNNNNNNNDDDGDDDSRREKTGDEENDEEEEDKEEEEEDCANGNYDAETDSESQLSKDGDKKKEKEEEPVMETEEEKQAEESEGEVEEKQMEEEEEMAEGVEETKESEEDGKVTEESLGEAEEPVKEPEEDENLADVEDPEKESVEDGEESVGDTKSPEKKAESVGESGEHVKEEEKSGEESNCSAGSEHNEVKGDDVTEKTDIKTEVKKEEEENDESREEEGKTDVKMEIKTEEANEENEESEPMKNLETENEESEPMKDLETENEESEPIKDLETENEETAKKDENNIEENGENETTNEDETKDDNAESLELTCESDQDEAGPSTSKRKEYTDTGNSSDVEVIDVKKPKFTSDEELVKNFLQHSPSSISITPPRKSQYSKPPSAEALQALATLRQLKSISTTRVRRRRNENGDVVVIRDPPTRERNFVNNVPTSAPRIRHPVPQSRNRGGLPVISNVQSINRNRPSNNLTPKIVTVQGNVSNFYNRSNNVGFPNRMNNTIPGFNHFPQFNNQFNNFSMFNNRQPQSSLKISNVRGNISFGPQPQLQRRFVNPTTSFRQTAPSSSTGAKDKNKKPVEYVVLD